MAKSELFVSEAEAIAALQVVKAFLRDTPIRGRIVTYADVQRAQRTSNAYIRQMEKDTSAVRQRVSIARSARASLRKLAPKSRAKIGG